ncbi:dTDP-4-dehydrorhamnose reductase [Prolixibacteraceae bacterium JC049]|nr:dTDP-4-dehydrorhamnose reductase [Prolixibacteraceae bacterium JC049]
MKQILVTGANGQLGNEIQVLAESYSNWKFHFTDVADLDITNEAAVRQFVEKHSIDTIINCAAYTAVDRAEEEKELAMKINADAPELCAKICNEKNIPFLHVSTDYVFDGQNCRPYSETDQVSPVLEYGKTKLAGEERACNVNPNTIVVRTSWLYSCFGNNFVKTMMRLGAERDSLNVVFDQVGSPTNAADLAKALLTMVEQILNKTVALSDVAGVYHFSNEGVCSWYDFAVEIMAKKQLDCKVSPITSDKYPTPAARPAFSVLNKDKIKSNFSVIIPHWRESLNICIDKIKM